MSKKPLHPSQKLVTAGEVAEMIQFVVLTTLDRRYVKRHDVAQTDPPSTQSGPVPPDA